MLKRTITLLAAASLAASLLVVAGAPVGAAVTVPETALVTDPLNDGNFLNDQGNRDLPTGFQGNRGTPADGSTVGDILKMWITNDAETVTLHYQTERPGPATTSIVYRAYSNPGQGPKGSSVLGCLRWEALIPGAAQGQQTTYRGKEIVKLIDRCNDGANVFNNGVEGKYEISAGPDGSGILSLTFPRAYSPLLVDDAKIVKLYGETRIAGGGETPAATTYNSSLTIDNTDFGSDYTITAGGHDPEPEPEPTPTPTPTPTPKPKPGSKGKRCRAFRPGEYGAEKPTIKVTDKATEAKPLEQTVEMGASLADLRLLSQIPAAGPLAYTEDVFNVQVDSKKKTVGLYASVAFASRRDYDLNLFHKDKSYAARSRAFNPVVGTPAAIFSEPGHGGAGTDASEKLDGITTRDCGGWTMNVENHLGEGGELTVKLWLGEPKVVPLAPGEEKPA